MTGRICFVSERRGGFLRCGIRPDPTYTLHSMRADGQGIMQTAPLVTHNVSINEAISVYEQLRDKPGEMLGVIFDW